MHTVTRGPRRRLPRMIGVGIAALLVVAGAVTPVEARSRPVSIPDRNNAEGTNAEGTALTSAKASGFPVEVAGSRSEVSRTLATPAGQLVHEVYPVPKWVRKDGGWRPIDTTLRTVDGAVVPVSTLVDVRMSGGGSGPLVTVAVAGGRWSMSWPGRLPAPRLEGDTAVYPSVLAGVDLRVSALPDGFSWVLVVHTAAAAANPALTRLRFPLATSGLTAHGRAGNGFEVVNRAGEPVLRAGKALMWDASGLAAQPAQTGARAGRRAEDVLRSAPDLSRKAELATRVEGKDLVVVPDPQTLRGAATAYPVVIDPSVTINRIRWGYTGSENATRDDGVARVGKSPDGSGTFRSFFAFNLAGLAGKQVRGVKFVTLLKHSWSCTSTPVNLYRSADLTTAGKQAWDGPNLQLWLQQRSGHAHKPSTGAGCEDDPQDDLPMEFATAALTNDVAASRGQTNYTLALSARQSDGTDESTQSWWKKFSPGATKLTVEYNTPPNTPTAAQLSTHADYTAPAQACGTGSGSAALRSLTPWLKATLTDPDGVNGGLLTGTFEMQRRVPPLGGWFDQPGWPKTDTRVAPGAKGEIQIPSGLTSGDRIRWRVRTSDSLGGASAASSPWCEVEVDAAPPAVTPSVTAADGVYLESPPGGDNQDLRGGLGKSGRFTFGANGVADVFDYVYQLAGGPEMVVRASGRGGPATVWATPMHAGENVLTVRSRDQAGNRSAPYDYKFLVGEASAPAAVWSLDEGTGTVADTTPAGGPALTLTGGASWADGRLRGTHENTGQDRAVRFTGTTQSADAAAALIDTSTSFSVAAWVRPTVVAGGFRTAVSQDGEQISGFFLEAAPAPANQWWFARHTTDTVGATHVAARSTSAPVLGVWTHVAGVYDAGTQQLRLYVNGVQEAVVGYPPDAAWKALGPLRVGRAKVAGAPRDFFAGDVAEIRVWDRVIEPDIDLDPIVSPVLAGQWEMEDRDEEAPREVSDESGYGRPATLSETSAQWGDGYNFSTGLVFDGLSGYAGTAAPVVYANQSFTVTAWVRRDSPTGFQAVLGQDGVVNSPFYLRYQDNYPGGAWVFGMRGKDDPTGTQAAAFVAGTNNAWTHLAGVYDAHLGEIRLYVNGSLVNRASYRHTWDGAGPFTIGRMRYLNAPADPWTGAVDRVRVWQGALTNAQINALWAEP